MSTSGRASVNTTPYEAFGREVRLRLARSEILRWLATLSAKDSAAAREACRALATRYRLDAERQRCPIVREFAIESAEKFAQMASELERPHHQPAGAEVGVETTSRKNESW